MARPNPQPASTEWEKGSKLNHQQAPNGGKKLFGARKVFFRLAGLLVVGKNFSGPKKFFSPIRCFGAPNLQYSLCCPLRFPHSCAQRKPPPKRMCSFAAAVQGHTSAGGHQLQMCLAIGLRRDQHKPKLSTLRRARQTHQASHSRLTKPKCQAML